MMEETLVIRRTDGGTFPLETLGATLAARADAAPDPALAGVWWICGDREYLGAAIERRRGGREPYAARLALAPEALTFRLDCVAFCLEAARAVAAWVVETWPCRLEDGCGNATTIEAAFA